MVRQSCGVIFTIDGQAIDFGKEKWWGWEPRLRRLDPLDATDGWNSEGESGQIGDAVCYTKVKGPGRYRVTVPDVQGFEHVEPFEIEIPAGQMVEHTILLQPKR